MTCARARNRPIVLALVLLVVVVMQGPLAPARAETPPSDPDQAPAPALGDLSAIQRVGPVGTRAGAFSPDLLDRLSIAAGAGYGFTGSVLGRDDRHHRFLGNLAAEWAALPSLHLGLRLTGRTDRHHIGGGDGIPPSDDDGWTGEPQLGVRLAHGLTQHTQAGLALHVDLPGGRAPSIEPAAIGGDLTAALAHTAGSFGFTAALGYRLDRSARAVPPADRLSPADRVGLGVNAFDAVKAQLALHHRRGDLTVFAEATLDALVGAGHPPAGQWPLHVDLGGRHPLSASLTGEGSIGVTLSQRPSLATSAPLVDLPPRVIVLLGLLWAAPAAGHTSMTGPSRAAARPTTVRDGAPTTTAALPVGQLRCSVRSFGGVGISASLRIIKGPDVPANAAPLLSRDGTFAVELAPGSYEVLIEAAHFVPQRRTITVERNGVTLLNADLRRAR